MAWPGRGSWLHRDEHGVPAHLVAALVRPAVQVRAPALPVAAESGLEMPPGRGVHDHPARRLLALPTGRHGHGLDRPAGHRLAVTGDVLGYREVGSDDLLDPLGEQVRHAAPDLEEP